jgi:glyoxylate/hydroxypyruvate reductase A
MKAPTFLFACFGVDTDAWLEAIRRAAPDLDLRVYPDLGDADEIEYVLAWNAPATLWSRLPQLKAIFSMGAGVDKILKDPAIPTKIPLVRLVDSSLIAGMKEFVLMRVLHYHRLMPRFEAAQQSHIWTQLRAPLAQERRVGIMGLGQLGESCAKTLHALGFETLGWSRTRKTLEGVRCFAGEAQLAAFCAETEVLVCILPLTPQTENILDAKLFAQLPQGAYIINVARGAHLVDADLIAALDSRQLAGATLDVFRTEPLPPEHPFWTHPRISILPHISALYPTQNRRTHLAWQSL